MRKLRRLLNHSARLGHLRALGHDERGFTLIEALMTMVLIAIAFAPILAMFNTGILSQSSSQGLTGATHRAQAVIEELRAGPFTNVVAQPWTAIAGTSYEYQVTIGPPPDPTIDNIREVTVSVRWAGKQGAEVVKLTTWIAED